MNTALSWSEDWVLFHKIRWVVPPTQERLLVTHPVQAEYRMKVLSLSGDWKTTAEPISTRMVLRAMELLDQDLWMFQLDISQKIENQFWAIAHYAALMCAEYNSGDLRLLDAHREKLDANAEYIYQQVLDISWKGKADSTDAQTQNRLNLLRWTTIRNDILVYLMNYAEYLSRRCDYWESMEWYQKCLTVAQLLGSAQFYFDAQLHIHGTFPNVNEPSWSDIMGMKQLIEDCNTFVYRDDGSWDWVHMTEPQRRNRTNMKHYALLEVYMYFKTYNPGSADSSMFFRQLENFEWLRGEFIASFALGVTPVFELCSLIIVHKIEHAISGHVWRMHQSRLDLPDSAKKYINANFWLPPNIHLSDRSHDRSAVISKSILYQDCFHLSWVDMRFPAIQAFMNADRCSSGSIPREDIEDQLCYIALKMLWWYSTDVASGFRTFFERNKSDIHIQQFIETVCTMRKPQNEMLTQTAWALGDIIVSEYLREILFKWWRYFREILDEAHPQWWCLVYSIWNETFSIDHSKGLVHGAIEDMLYRHPWSSRKVNSQSLLSVVSNWPTPRGSVSVLADPEMYKLFADFYASHIKAKSEAQIRRLQVIIQLREDQRKRLVSQLSSLLTSVESRSFTSGTPLSLNLEDQNPEILALLDWEELTIRVLRELIMWLQGNTNIRN